MKNLKKISGLFVLVFALLLTGCGSNNEDSNLITVSGSTSVAPLMESLIEAYEENNDVTFNFSVDGSSAGVTAAAEGVSDIGMVSRDLSDSEKELGLTENVIATDGIAIILNPENDVTNLTFEQVQQIYTGEITNWNEVGGSDLPIVIISREDGSGTRGAFDEIVGLLNEDGTSKMVNPIIGNGTGGVIESISQNPAAIGYVSASSAHAAGDDVKIISVNDVNPDSENIRNGSYPISRRFDIVSKNESQATLDFIAWILSEQGQEIVEQRGYTPIN